jgi:hypothetical protein
MTAYWEKLRDPRWQRKRLEAMEAAEFSCEMCCDDKSTLNVHHKAYFKGREPGDYDVDQLCVLCEACHEDYHSGEDVLSLLFSRLALDGPQGRITAASLLSGFLGRTGDIPEDACDKNAYFAGGLAVILFYERRGIHGIVEACLADPDGMRKAIADYAEKANRERGKCQQG